MSQNTASIANRRVDGRRVPKGCTKVTCRKGTLDLGSSIALKLLDVAETGVRLLVRDKLRPDQEVTITLESPNHFRPLRVVGQVMWCQETVEHTYCVGIQFRQRLKYVDIAKLT